MTGVETIARVRFEHFQNRKGIKRIARELGVARDTVRKAPRSQATEFSYKRTTQPAPKLGPWVDTLTAILEAVVTTAPTTAGIGSSRRGGWSMPARRSRPSFR